jgi:hypothetical protein
LAQIYDPSTGTYTDYYVSDDETYASYITANLDWSVYEGKIEYTGTSGSDCGYNVYYYTSDGVSESEYISADGEYEAYYDFTTEYLSEFSYSYYDESTSDDNLSGTVYYLASDEVYFTYVSWDKHDGNYYIAYMDPETDITYYADALWYYTEYVDNIAGTADSTYADYYNEYDDGAGYTSVVYANADWSSYNG